MQLRPRVPLRPRRLLPRARNSPNQPIGMCDKPPSQAGAFFCALILPGASYGDIINMIK